MKVAHGTEDGFEPHALKSTRICLQWLNYMLSNTITTKPFIFILKGSTAE